MRTYGTKRILSVYGNSRPVERRINNIRIAGWKEQPFNGISVSQNDTYNDSAYLRIYGKSEQVQTVQGKNLLPFPLDLETYTVTHHGVPPRTSSTQTDEFVRIQGSEEVIDTAFRFFSPMFSLNPNTTYTISFKAYVDSSTFTSWDMVSDWGVALVSQSGVRLSQQQNLKTVQKEWITYKFVATTNSEGLYYLRLGTDKPNLINGFILIDRHSIQIELGSTATEYEPFVPNSPSPDYPSTINSVSNFDLVSSDGGSKTQTINFPYTLRSLPDGTKDYIEIDNVNKTTKLYRYIGEKIFDGTENWVFGGGKNTFTPININLQCDIANRINSISTHFKYLVNYTENCFWIESGGNYARFTNTNFTTINDFKNWLTAQYAAGTPVTVQYQLATPTVEDLDYNEVKTYYPFTQIYTNAEIQPTLEGSLKIIDRW